MSRDRSPGRNGTRGRNRPAAALEDTDPMTREDILEAFGHSGPDASNARLRHRPDRTPPDPDPGDDPRPPS